LCVCDVCMLPSAEALCQLRWEAVTTCSLGRHLTLFGCWVWCCPGDASDLRQLACGDLFAAHRRHSLEDFGILLQTKSSAAYDAQLEKVSRAPHMRAASCMPHIATPAAKVPQGAESV
jgi:hypothetical protein